MILVRRCLDETNAETISQICSKALARHFEIFGSRETKMKK
jgi:hypothetical protein